MNVHAPISQAPLAYDDRPVHLLKVSDVLAMVEAGAMLDTAPVELIEGVLVEMASKNRRHEMYKTWITKSAVFACADDFVAAPESTLYLSEETFTEPDLCLCPRGKVPPDLAGDEVLLVLEIADTTARYDLNTKARIYATHGVRDYWVVDVNREVTVVHRNPAGERFGSVLDVPFDQPVEALLVPSFQPHMSEAV